MIKNSILAKRGNIFEIYVHVYQCLIILRFLPYHYTYLYLQHHNDNPTYLNHFLQNTQCTTREQLKTMSYVNNPGKDRLHITFMHFYS